MPTTHEELMALHMNDVKFMMLDTETTGASEDGDQYGPHKVIELAARTWSVHPNRRLRGGVEAIVDPGRPIDPDAMAAHHLLDSDVAGSETLEEVMPRFTNFIGNWPIVAYNAEFDKRMLADTPLHSSMWIDAYRLAMHVWAIGDENAKGYKLSNFKQQNLRYWLGIGQIEGQAHRAMADITVTGMVFQRAVKHFRTLGLGETLGDFVRWVDSPLQLRTIPVGPRSMVGKTPAELSTYDLARIFNPTDPMFEIYKRWNIDTYCHAELVNRRMREHMDRVVPAATRKSTAWANEAGNETASAPEVEEASPSDGQRPRRRRGPSNR
jgi:exodeoxyribonuclease X